MKDQLLQLLMAIADKRSSEVVEIARKIGSPKIDYNEDGFRDDIASIVENSTKGAIGDLNVGGLIMQIISSCATHGLRIPNSLYMVGKMLINLDGVGQALCQNFDAAASIRKHAAPLIASRMRSQFDWQVLMADFVEVKDFMHHAPRRVNQLMDNVANNNLKIRVDSINEDKLLNGFQKVANRITLGLLLAAMIVAASLMMRIESAMTLFGYPALAIVVFLTAAIGAVGLIFIMLKEN